MENQRKPIEKQEPWRGPGSVLCLWPGCMHAPHKGDHTRCDLARSGAMRSRPNLRGQMSAGWLQTMVPSASSLGRRPWNWSPSIFSYGAPRSLYTPWSAKMGCAQGFSLKPLRATPIKKYYLEVDGIEHNKDFWYFLMILFLILSFNFPFKWPPAWPPETP